MMATQQGIYEGRQADLGVTEDNEVHIVAVEKEFLVD